MPFSRSRRATAEHMARSRATAAHALVTVEVDYTAVDRVRAGTGLSYLPFVARAVVDGLREFPHLNASVGDDCLIVHPDVHLGLAVDVDGDSLVVPVVRVAADRRLPALAEAFADVAVRARTSRLTPDELSGATFTLTNVGAYGTVMAAPIINQPQVAILSTDGVGPRPGRDDGPRRRVGRHRAQGRQPLAQLRPPGRRRRLCGPVPRRRAHHPRDAGVAE